MNKILKYHLFVSIVYSYKGIWKKEPSCLSILITLILDNVIKEITEVNLSGV